VEKNWNWNWNTQQNKYQTHNKLPKVKEESKMEGLDRIAKYFNERDRKKLEGRVKETKSGFPEMTASYLHHPWSCVFLTGHFDKSTG
jgi:hypothetical protein